DPLPTSSGAGRPSSRASTRPAEASGGSPAVSRTSSGARGAPEGGSPPVGRGHAPAGGGVRGLAGGVEDQRGGPRRLVGVVDPGEAAQLPPRLAGVQALDVPGPAGGHGWGASRT